MLGSKGIGIEAPVAPLHSSSSARWRIILLLHFFFVFVFVLYLYSISMIKKAFCCYRK